MKQSKKLFFVLVTGFFVNASMAQMGSKMDNSMDNTVMVGGAAMYPSKNIIENA